MNKPTRLSGVELRQAINSLARGARVYVALCYNGRIWPQRWRKADALQLSKELSRMRWHYLETHGRHIAADIEDTEVSVSFNGQDLHIHFKLE